jgi:ribosomal protein L3 glutamine methyltransferase
MTEHLLPTLLTVRDWLRYAVSRFNEAELVFGHGTSTALDEAAFLLLSTLHLPPDQLDPWLDARLTMPERKAVADIIEKRVVSRKPASYLTRSAWIGPHKFYVDERVIVPRSYIGELLNDGLVGVIDEPTVISSVLDLCTGSGCLGIIAALQFPDATVDVADISRDALAVARRNIGDFGLTERITAHEGDLFGAVGDAAYDLILCNPPYVTEAAVEAFPAEYRAEPRLAHDGGKDGMTLVRRLLADAGRHLTANGTLLVEIGFGRAIIESEYGDLPFLWLDTAGSEGEVFALHATGLRSAKGGKARGRSKSKGAAS